MLFAFLTLTLLAEVPTKFPESRPYILQTKAQLRWRDLRESGQNFSGVEAAAAIGLQTDPSEVIHGGVEISTYNNTQDSDPAFVSLTHDSTSKSIGISQVFLNLHLHGAFDLEIVGGKFLPRLRSSPLSMSTSWNPEGFNEDFSWSNADKTIGITIFATQMPLIQIAPSSVGQTNFENRWILQEGLLLESGLSDNLIRFGVGAQTLKILSIPQSLAVLSSTRGNSFTGSQSDPNLSASFHTTEFSAFVAALPLGISSRIFGAVAINWESADYHRGFFIEGNLGDPWIKGNLLGSLSYYYAEPDLILSAISDHRYGFTNRESFLGSVSYFPTDSLKGEIMLLYAKTIAHNPSQSSRKELSVTWGLRF